MSYLEAVILGLVQGVTEFLPISSSGHLVLFKNWFELAQLPRIFDIILHLGSLIVVLYFFRDIVIYYIKNLSRFCVGKRDEAAKEALDIFIKLIVASAITVIIMLPFPEITNPKIVSMLFIITGLFLLLPHFFPRQKKDNESQELKTLSWKQVIFTGIAQGFATLPGVSRSGSTITAGLLTGMSRKTTSQWAFLLFIPAVIGGVILDSGDTSTVLNEVGFAPFLVAFVVTLLSGLLSIRLLTFLVSKGKLGNFAYYLIPLGIIGIYFF